MEANLGYDGSIVLAGARQQRAGWQQGRRQSKGQSCIVVKAVPESEDAVADELVAASSRCGAEAATSAQIDAIDSSPRRALEEPPSARGRHDRERHEEGEAASVPETMPRRGEPAPTSRSNGRCCCGRDKTKRHHRNGSERKQSRYPHPEEVGSAFTGCKIEEETMNLERDARTAWGCPRG